MHTWRSVDTRPSGSCLGMWVYDQKRNWKNGKLYNPERYEWLAEIGMFEGGADHDASMAHIANNR